jgi:antitoxin PrlF
MTTLTVTAKGQVTLRKELLVHLGVEPGQKIEVSEMPDGRIVVKAAAPRGTLKDFSGLLAGKTKKVATLEEIDEAIAKSWAGRR